MTGNDFLFMLIISLIVSVFYGIKSNKLTDQERDEMLDSEEMFP